MAKLAIEAMKHWDALEKDAGVSLRWMGGLLNFGDKDMGGDTPEGTISCLLKFPFANERYDRNFTGAY
jgi:sarcosine oxidase/L-pipecolate oxidase